MDMEEQNQTPKTSIFHKSWFRYGAPAALLLLAVGILLLPNLTGKLSWRTYDSSKSESLPGEVISLAIDPQGRPWVGTTSGIGWLDADGTWTFYPLGLVSRLIFDSQGQIWVVTDLGLGVLDSSGQWVGNYYRGEMSALAVDQQGNIWVGARQGYAADQQGNEWVNVRQGLVVIAPDGNIIHSISDYIDGPVNIIAIDPQGRAWVSSPVGLSMYSPEEGWVDYLDEDSGLNQDTIRSLAFDSSGRVWVGSSTGDVGVLGADGTWRLFNSNNARLPAFIAPWMVVDQQDQVWFAAKEALSVLRTNGRWDTYTPTNSGWVTDMPCALRMDQQGRLWTATFSGTLTVFQPNTILPGSVTSLLQDLRMLAWGLLILAVLGLVLPWLFARPLAETFPQRLQ